MLNQLCKFLPTWIMNVSFAFGQVNLLRRVEAQEKENTFIKMIHGYIDPTVKCRTEPLRRPVLFRVDVQTITVLWAVKPRLGNHGANCRRRRNAKHKLLPVWNSAEGAEQSARSLEAKGENEFRGATIDGLHNYLHQYIMLTTTLTKSMSSSDSHSAPTRGDHKTRKQQQQQRRRPR